MGEISEYYREVDDDTAFRHLKLKVETFKFWKTGQTKKISIKSMSVPHLMNAIDKIVRDKWRTTWYKPLMAELDLRNYDK